MEDLIIIIPTHNRQHYLRRVIKYYSEFPCKVYICDSSKEKADIESSGNIIYRWVPQSNFYGKVLDVLNETSADFYALSPDDDFLKQETLMECYEKLNQNNQYAVANGLQYLFKKDFDNKLYYNPTTNGFRHAKEIKNDQDGIRYFWNHYQNILWSLFRRQGILNAFTILERSGFGNGNFVELLLSIESLKIGTVLISDNPFNFMEINPHEHWGNTTPPISWMTYIKNKTLRNDIRVFKKIYYDDVVANESLRLYMGNPIAFLSHDLLINSKKIIGKFLFKSKRNKIGEISLPEVQDIIMAERIAKVYKDNIRNDVRL